MLLFPYLVALGAVSCYAILTPLAKKFQVDLPPFAFITASSAILAVTSFVCSFFIEKDFLVTKTTSATWINILLFSAINLIGYFAYLKALEKIPAANYQLMYLLSPIIVAISAYFILGERVEIRQIIGLIIMSAGLCIAIWPKAVIIP
jgi:drug/metabolite transporter (DMT)-like permease